MDKCVVLIGYGGHGLVAADILLQGGKHIEGYCENSDKQFNPYRLHYLGIETDFFAAAEHVASFSAFVAIGNSALRQAVFQFLKSKKVLIVNAIHPTACVAKESVLGQGVFVAAGATINPCCNIGDGVICNTSSSIDHECVVGDFSHICPGAVLCGNVKVGKNCFVGASSTVIPGIKIGDRVVVGAGSTVINNLLTGGVYVGSPARLIR